MFAITELSRFRAASLHFGISAVIAGLAMTLMLALWYPPPLFGAMGGQMLILLIVGVDVAIGPLITLIVFDPRKKGLSFDLSVIALLQLSALIYGVYAMHAGRPVFIAFIENRFAVVAAAELEGEALAKARAEFRTLPEFGPLVVAVDMPSDPNELSNVLFASVAGLGAQHLPQYYAPYADRLTKVREAARPLDAMSDLSVAEDSELSRAIARLERPHQQLRFLPMLTRFATLTALVDARTGDLLVTVAVDPVKP